jgi:hypothetical protein
LIYDHGFIAAHFFALIGWFALFALPKVGLKRGLLWARLSGGLLCFAYVVMLIANWSALPHGEGFNLTSVAAAFAMPGLALTFWIHYLAFDLWVGAWEAEDAAERGVPHAVLVPCLIATFMIGPLGLLLYLALRRLGARPTQ